MILTCFGTAAAEGIPALYCSCPLCETARQRGGREIRSRHLAQVDDDLQFDLGPDIFYQIQALKFNPRSIRHLMITHTHSDHFAMDSLNMRASPFSLARDHEIQVIGSEETIKLVLDELRGTPDRLGLRVRAIDPFETIALDGETALTAMPANHAPGLGAMVYLLERAGQKLLYAHDTGPLFPEVISFLKGRGIDGASLDCTGAYHGAGQYHLRLSGCDALVRELKTNGAIKEDCKVIISHFSHGGGALHSQLEEEARLRGWTAAYDGITVQI